jgi:hypothetical protein
MTSYGIDCPPALFDRPRTSFTDMVLGLLPDLGRYADGLDVAVLTGVTPDCQPGFPVGRLSDAVTGLGLAFAVFDQGVVAPFTALRVLAGAARADQARRAALFVLDQSTPVHERPVPERLRVREDCAVALVLDAGGELGTVWEPESSVVPAGEVAARVAAVPADQLVCGLGLAPYRPAGRSVRSAPAGLPATGVWAVLADGLAGWRGRRVVLADYDADEQRLCTCAVDVAP